MLMGDVAWGPWYFKAFEEASHLTNDIYTSAFGRGKDWVRGADF